MWQGGGLPQCGGEPHSCIFIATGHPVRQRRKSAGVRWSKSTRIGNFRHGHDRRRGVKAASRKLQHRYDLRLEI